MFRKVYSKTPPSIPTLSNSDQDNTFSRVGIRRFSRSLYHWNANSEDKNDPRVDSIKTALSKANEQRSTSLSVGSVKKLNDVELSINKRIVVVTKISANIGIKSILAQVCGGPLERINFHRQRGVAELYFIFSDQAQRFYEYATSTNFFIVNGKRLQVEWANKSNTDDLDFLHPQVPRYLLKEIFQWGARRCLVFSKVVTTKTIKDSTVLHYPSAKTHFSRELDIAVIKDSLSEFGEIIDIGPVISRKLCFSVHYADVRSAIVAKKVCETMGSPLYLMFSEWSIWYGKDPTDLPCKLI